MDEKTAVRVSNVRFAYEDGADVFEGVSFDIDKGDFFCVVGDNGAGKSTLLKLLVGTLRPTGGGIDRAGAGRSAYVAQRHAAQNHAFPATAAEIVSLGLYGRRLSAKARRAAADAALDKVGLLAKRAAQIGKLSGGQRQRVLIAKALAAEPDTLYLDEPTVGVDAGSAGSICCILGELNRAGMTIVMVTHDMPSIVAHATRILDFKHTGDVVTYPAAEYEKTFEHINSHD